MSRRRYISTDISVDKRVRKLSDSAALLYTWMIPHAEEDGTITSDPEELAAIVVPNRPGWTEKKIVSCVAEIEEQGLIIKVNGTMYFPVSSFYKYQSNVAQERRRNADPESTCKSGETARNSTEQHGTAQNSVSSSSSVSSSNTHMPSTLGGVADTSPLHGGDARRKSIVNIFEHWRSVMGKSSRAPLDTKRESAIRRGLNALSEDECKLAIDGCALTPWNMGVNPSRKKYDGLTLIFRDAEHWESFIDTATKHRAVQDADELECPTITAEVYARVVGQ